MPRQVNIKIIHETITLSLQVNYLIDEACNTGKGANTIISLLHHFLATHGLGETSVHFHADNCCGQNKNRFLMCYFMWRILAGLHQDIKISFLPVGHTKFAPDWCFGLLKQQYRRTSIGCLDDIVQAVNMSATPNNAQLVGSQSGEPIVHTYNWGQYFDQHTIKTALRGIKKIQHFHFSSSFPGKVKVSNELDGTETTITLRKDPSWTPSSVEHPELVVPPGLPLERQWYLYDKIREFCPDHCKDLVCPRPTESMV